MGFTPNVQQGVLRQVFGFLRGKALPHDEGLHLGCKAREQHGIGGTVAAVGNARNQTFRSGLRNLVARQGAVRGHVGPS